MLGKHREVEEITQISSLRLPWSPVQSVANASVLESMKHDDAQLFKREEEEEENMNEITFT